VLSRLFVNEHMVIAPVFRAMRDAAKIRFAAIEPPRFPLSGLEFGAA